MDAFAIYAATLVRARHVTLRAFDAAGALLVLERERVSVTNMATTMLQLLLSHHLAPSTDLSTLRMLTCGGSPLPGTAARAALAALGSVFAQSYGATEACGKLAMSLVPAGLDPDTALRAIATSGRPFSLVEMRLVARRPAPTSK